MEALPTELMLEILLNLSLYDISRLKQISKIVHQKIPVIPTISLNSYMESTLECINRSGGVLESKKPFFLVAKGRVPGGPLRSRHLMKLKASQFSMLSSCWSFIYQGSCNLADSSYYDQAFNFLVHHGHLHELKRLITLQFPSALFNDNNFVYASSNLCVELVKQNILTQLKKSIRYFISIEEFSPASYIQFILESEKLPEVVKKKVSLMFINEPIGNRLIHWACAEGHFQIVQQIINLCRDYPDVVNTRDASGYTPVHYASRYNHPKTLQLLISHGSDYVSATTFAGWRAIHYAVNYAHIECLKILIAAEEKQNSGGKSGNESIINSATIRGWKPIHFASHQGNYECLSLLLNRYDENYLTTYINSLNTAGLKAMDYVKDKTHRQNYLDCYRLLIKSGDKI